MDFAKVVVVSFFETEALAKTVNAHLVDSCVALGHHKSPAKTI